MTKRIHDTFKATRVATCAHAHHSRSQSVLVRETEAQTSSPISSEPKITAVFQRVSLATTQVLNYHAGRTTKRVPHCVSPHNLPTCVQDQQKFLVLPLPAQLQYLASSNRHSTLQHTHVLTEMLRCRNQLPAHALSINGFPLLSTFPYPPIHQHAMQVEQGTKGEKAAVGKLNNISAIIKDRLIQMHEQYLDSAKYLDILQSPTTWTCQSFPEILIAFVIARCSQNWHRKPQRDELGCSSFNTSQGAATPLPIWHSWNPVLHRAAIDGNVLLDIRTSYSIYTQAHTPDFLRA